MSQLVRQISPPPLVRTSQPQGPVWIDWGNPITQGLQFAFNGANPKVEAAFSRPASTDGSAGVTAGVGQFGGYLKGNSGTAGNYRPWTGITGTAAYTAMAVVKDSAGRGAIRNPFDSDDTNAGGAARNFQLRFDATNVATFIAFNTTQSAFTSSTTATSSDNGLSVICGRVTDSKAVNVFLNGVSGSTATLTGSTAALASTERLAVGGANKPTASGVPFLGEIYACFFWNRALSDTEIRSLSQNPWQIFKPIVRPYPFDLVRGPVQTRESRMLGTSDGAASSVAPAVLGLRSVCTQQPQQAGAIDWSNPITRGIISVQDGRSGRDVVGGIFGTLSNASSISSAATGLGVGTNYNQNQIDFPLSKVAGSSTAGSILFVGELSSGTWNVATVNNGMVVRKYSGGFTIALGGSGSVYNVSAWSGVGAVVGISWNDALARPMCFLNGKDVGARTSTNTDGSNWYLDSTLGGSRVGDRGAATYWAKPALLSVRWNRNITPQEAASLSQNPWQIFRPLNRQVWVAA